MKYLLEAAQCLLSAEATIPCSGTVKRSPGVTRFYILISVFYDHNSHGLGIVHDMLHGRGLAPRGLLFSWQSKGCQQNVKFNE